VVALAPFVLPAISFGLQAYSSISEKNEKNRQVRIANKAKLANWENTKRQYYNQILLDNAAWKDSVQNSNIAIDNLFTAQAKEWESQDLQLEEVINAHAANKINLIKKMYESEYAGEQTGVTAQRKARSSIRDAGHALTESVRKVVLAEKKIDLAKEAGAITTESKRRAQWMQTRQSPIPGVAPPPPQLQNLPGNKGLALTLAIAGAQAAIGYGQAKQLEKTASATQDIASAILKNKKGLEAVKGTSTNIAKLTSTGSQSQSMWQVGDGLGITKDLSSPFLQRISNLNDYSSGWIQ